MEQDKIEIIYEDKYCIVVNKPNNVLIHQSHYARNIKAPTLIDLLEHQFNQRFYPVHRLDRKTSGILLFCKQKENVAVFQELFTSDNIEKRYWGIVRGFAAPSGKIDSPVKNPDTKIYKDALTFYKTLTSIQLDIPVHPYPQSRYSLIELTPKTGRMHQLRIHLNKISHPLVGDYKYGDRFHNRMYENQFDCHNLFLHAIQLSFTHPFTKEDLVLKASLNKNWELIFEHFGWDNLT
ncbi:MAG: pseudouridine synthase [Flavobacteriales bacterium]|jgi:tRNA pseudouridine65 synthase|nr:pseudouridine synthase [Flavobacteriales bacterium]